MIGSARAQLKRHIWYKIRNISHSGRFWTALCESRMTRVEEISIIRLPPCLECIDAAASIAADAAALTEKDKE